MSEAGSVDEALRGWDPRRRAALEELWELFRHAGVAGVSLSDELIAERHREAAAAEASDQTSPSTSSISSTSPAP